MNKEVNFATPSGDQMVVITRKEYDLLLEAYEDLQDLRSYDEAKQKLATGEEEMVPAEYVNRMIDGESPVRVWREFRGLSAKELAAKAGLSPAYLSEIETGKKDGSISALKSIADVLKLDLDDLYWNREEKGSSEA